MISTRGGITILGGFVLAVVLAMLFVGCAQAINLPDGMTVLAVYAIFFGVPVALYWHDEQKRAKEHAYFAQVQGFEPLEGHVRDGLFRSLRAFPTLSRSSIYSLSAKGYRNLLRTSVGGMDVFLLDHSFPFTPLLHWQTLVLCRSAGLILPQFFLHLRREASRTGATQLPLGEEVLVHPALMRRYSLRAVDPDRVQRIFTTEVISYYVKHKGLHTEAAGSTLVVYRPGKLVRPEQLHEAVEEAVLVVGLFKTAVSATHPSADTTHN